MSSKKKRKGAGSQGEHLSPNQAGALIGVTGEAVKQWIYQLKLPATKLPNGYWRIRRTDLERFVQARGEAARKRILLASDDKKLSAAACKAIDAAGYRAIVAHNDIDALLKAAENRPALLIIDLTVRTFDGWRLSAEMRKTQGTRKLPIIFLGAHTVEAGEAAQALKAGAQAFLRKPLDVGLLCSEIEHIFAGIL